MAGGKSQRRVATVVFTDVVDSTRIAAEVGDARWRELLRAFRATVRGQLKRYNGHEVDTAGDGFFAWFDSPANAIRAAVAICADSQQHGLDVRCGLHTGELEQIDGRLGGIAAHIGARVMAAAGPAEVLATTTVRDLVVGGGVMFESAGESELKGVPGTWSLQRVVRVDGQKVASPLDPEEAGKRRSPAAIVVRGRRALGLAAAGAVLLVLVLLAASAYGIFGLGRSPTATLSPTQLANSSSSPRPTQTGGSSLSPTAAVGASLSPTPNLPLSMIAIDPSTNKKSGEVRDEHSLSGENRLLSFGGNLFQVYFPANTLVQRDLKTGEVRRETDLPLGGWGVQHACGSIWYAYREPYALFARIDPTSGQVTKTVDPKFQVNDFAVSDTAVYILDSVGQIHEMDACTNEVVSVFTSQAPITPQAIFFVDGNLYIPDGVPGDGVTVIDATSPTHEQVHRWTGIRQPQGSGAGAVDPSNGTLWLTNWQNNSVTPLELSSTQPGAPTGVVSRPHDIGLGFGAIWVTGAQDLFRIGSSDGVEKTIALPDGSDPGSMVMDTADGQIWVSNCHGPGC